MYLYAIIVFLIILIAYIYYKSVSSFTVSQQLATMQNDMSNLIYWFQSMNVIIESLKQINNIQFQANDIAVMNKNGTIYPSTTTNIFPQELLPILSVTIDTSIINDLEPIMNISSTASTQDVRSALYSAFSIIMPSIKIDKTYYNNIPPLFNILNTWLTTLYNDTVSSTGVYNSSAPISNPIAAAFCAAHPSVEIVATANIINFNNYMSIIIANASNVSIYKGYTVFNDLLAMYSLL